MNFFLHISLKEKKKSKTLTTSFLMLEAKDVNFKTIFAYSSIVLLKEVIGSISSLNFKP